MTEDESKKREAVDEATVFVLAGSALSLYGAMMSKNSVVVAAILIKLQKLLGEDPTFIDRFTQAQKTVMDRFNSKPEIIIP